MPAYHGVWTNADIEVLRGVQLDHAIDKKKVVPLST
jgi:hypothetical protein